MSDKRRTAMISESKMRSALFRLGALAAVVTGCQGILGVEPGKPRPANGDAGAGCLHVSDCAEGLVCLFKVCSEPCKTDRDCTTSGTHCLKVGDQLACISSSQAACKTQQDCEPGTKCTDGECKAECDTTPNACPGGQRCAAGVCVSGGTDAGSGGAAQGGGANGSGGAGGGAGANGSGGGAGANGAGGTGVGGQDGGHGPDASVDGGTTPGAGGTCPTATFDFGTFDKDCFGP
jgi:hypothetical protein